MLSTVSGNSFLILTAQILFACNLTSKLLDCRAWEPGLPDTENPGKYVFGETGKFRFFNTNRSIYQSIFY